MYLEESSFGNCTVWGQMNCLGEGFTWDRKEEGVGRKVGRSYDYVQCHITNICN